MARTRQTSKSASRTSAARRAAAGTAAAVLIADQATKCLAVAGRIPSSPSASWISVGLGGNHGATGSVGSGSVLLVIAAALALTALAAALALRTANRTAALCLAAVVGGALGNLADRFLRSPGLGTGGVVDWIHINLGAGRGFTLNLADLAILLGALGATAAIVIARTNTTQNRKPATVALAV
jgi:signal peptidase II